MKKIQISEEQAHSMLDDIEFPNSMIRTEIISEWKKSGFIKELRPCPFCGGESRLCHVANSESSSPLYFVKCNCCDIRTPTYSSKETVVERWNNREGE